LVLDDSWRFDRFRDAIRDLPADIDRPTLMSETFRLYADGGLSIYYAPFDRVNTRARLALVGVTPGVDPDGDRLPHRTPRAVGRP
jgi:hypothetical protein